MPLNTFQGGNTVLSDQGGMDEYPLFSPLVVQGVAKCHAHAMNTEETVCIDKNHQVFQTWVLTVSFTFYPKSK